MQQLQRSSVPNCRSRPSTYTSRAAIAPRTCRLRVQAAKDGYKVIIVGGGSAGATVAGHYGRKFGKDVAIIEDADFHYYQPMFTLVGGGLRPMSDTVKPESNVLNKDADWIKTQVTGFDPDNSSLTTAGGRRLKYDYLVVATGMVAKWDAVKGLPEALGDGHVVSNYSPKYAPMTWQALQNVKKGHAIFTMPKGPVKCPGAGHKACWVSEDYLRKAGRRPDVTISYVTPSAKILGLQRYLPTLEKLCKDRDISVVPNTLLVEVRGEQQEAVFDCLGSDGLPTGEQKVLHYDMLHVTPLHGPVAAVANSPLANADGWVAVDKETMQHPQYPNVFAIGDCAAVPTGKTAAAAAAQFLALRDNLDALIAGRYSPETATRYDGYTSCPVVTKKGAVMLMEFGYDGKIMEMFTRFGIDQSKEQYLMWLVKTVVLPTAYWNLMVKGFVPWREIPAILNKMFAKRDDAQQQQQQGLQPGKDMRV